MSLTYDRYHAQMGDASTRVFFDKTWMSDTPVRFYATQRKLHAAPVVGHPRLMKAIRDYKQEGYEQSFLHEQKLYGFAAQTSANGARKPFDAVRIRAASEGTIMFAGQPFLDVFGPFLPVQTLEIPVEHAFDFPMTVASRAMEMVRAAKGHTVMDFSLRRDGDAERAFQVAQYAYIGGFDQTSNGDAARIGIPWVGTVAHYWQQMFVPFHGQDGKHWQQIAFEYWLDANPQGTTLLLDTISVELGIKHAIAAALSSPRRRQAFKAFRIDSGDLGDLARKATAEFTVAGLKGLTPILTGDLDASTLAQIVSLFERYDTSPGSILHDLSKTTFGVGTKLISEIERVAGVIYKLSEVNGTPTFKGAKNMPEKATLPGKLQVVRGIKKDGMYAGDVTTFDTPEGIEEAKEMLRPKGAVRFAELLQDFMFGSNVVQAATSFEAQRVFVKNQLEKFGFLMNYPTELSPQLKTMRNELLEIYSGKEFND